tara:strand:- start:555 stop:674 length:120 start_codon:yes stop_codon:yes gene_type:complete
MNTEELYEYDDEIVDSDQGDDYEEDYTEEYKTEDDDDNY